MDGRSPRLNARRVMEAVFAASLLSVLSIVVVGRPHPHPLADPAATRADHVHALRIGGLDTVAR